MRIASVRAGVLMRSKCSSLTGSPHLNAGVSKHTLCGGPASATSPPPQQPASLMSSSTASSSPFALVNDGRGPVGLCGQQTFPSTGPTLWFALHLAMGPGHPLHEQETHDGGGEVRFGHLGGVCLHFRCLVQRHNIPQLALKTLRKDLSRGCASGVLPGGTSNAITCGNCVRRLPRKSTLQCVVAKSSKQIHPSPRRLLVDVLVYHLHRPRGGSSRKASGTSRT